MAQWFNDFADKLSLIIVQVREATIPKAWGKFMTYNSGNLLLEGPDRSLRIVDLDGPTSELREKR